MALDPPLAALIPLLHAPRLVCAGDHCQLPPTVTSEDAAALREAIDASLRDDIEALRLRLTEVSARAAATGSELETQRDGSISLKGSKLDAALGRLPELARMFSSADDSSAEVTGFGVRFRQLAESIDEVFWITNADKSTMLYVSPAYERIWGRTCDELYRSPTAWAANAVWQPPPNAF